MDPGSLSAAELKTELKSRGLSASGDKPKLVRRLKLALGGRCKAEAEAEVAVATKAREEHGASQSAAPSGPSRSCEAKAGTKSVLVAGMLPTGVIEGREAELQTADFSAITINPRSIDVVLFHGGCPDGFTAAYAAWRLLGDRSMCMSIDLRTCPRICHPRHAAGPHLCTYPCTCPQRDVHRDRT